MFSCHMKHRILRTVKIWNKAGISFYIGPDLEIASAKWFTRAVTLLFALTLLHMCDFKLSATAFAKSLLNLL